jgi:hypothetical protein
MDIHAAVALVEPVKSEKSVASSVTVARAVKKLAGIELYDKLSLNGHPLHI